MVVAPSAADLRDERIEERIEGDDIGAVSWRAQTAAGPVPVERLGRIGAAAGDLHRARPDRAEAAIVRPPRPHDALRPVLGDGEEERIAGVLGAGLDIGERAGAGDVQQRGGCVVEAGVGPPHGDVIRLGPADGGRGDQRAADDAAAAGEHVHPVVQADGLAIAVGEDDVVQPGLQPTEIERDVGPRRAVQFDAGRLADGLAVGVLQPGGERAVELGADGGHGEVADVAAAGAVDLEDIELGDLGEQVEVDRAVAELDRAHQHVVGAALRARDRHAGLGRERLGRAQVEPRGGRHAVVRDEQLDRIGAGDRQAERLAGRRVDAVHDRRAAGQRDGLGSVKRERGQVDRGRVERDADVVRLVGLGDDVEDVAADDDLIVARHDRRQRRGERGGVAAAGRERAVALHEAEEGVVDVPLAVGREVDRIGPASGERTDAGVGHGVADRGRLPGQPADGHDDLADGEVDRRERIEVEPRSRAGVVEQAAVLIDALAEVGADDEVVGPDEPGRQPYGHLAGVAVAGVQRLRREERADRAVGAAIEHLIGRQEHRVVPQPAGRALADVGYGPAEHRVLPAVGRGREQRDIGDGQIGRPRRNDDDRVAADRVLHRGVVVALVGPLLDVVVGIGPHDDAERAGQVVGQRERPPLRVDPAGDECGVPLGLAEQHGVAVDLAVGREPDLIDPASGVGVDRRVVADDPLDVDLAGLGGQLDGDRLHDQVGRGAGDRDRHGGGVVALAAVLEDPAAVVGAQEDEVVAGRQVERQGHQFAGDAVGAARGDRLVADDGADPPVGRVERVVVREVHGVAPEAVGCPNAAVLNGPVEPDEPPGLDRSGDAVVERERGDGEIGRLDDDIDRRGGAADVVVAVDLEDAAVQVGHDEHMEAAKQVVGQRDRGEPVVAVAGRERTARVADLGDENVSRVEHIVGRQVDRVVPGALRRRGRAVVLDAVGDLDPLAADRHRRGRDRHRLQIGRRRQPDREHIGRRDVVVVGGVLEGLAERIGLHEQEVVAGHADRQRDRERGVVRLAGRKPAEPAGGAELDVAGVERRVVREPDAVGPTVLLGRAIALVGDGPEHVDLRAGERRERADRVGHLQVGRGRQVDAGRLARGQVVALGGAGRVQLQLLVVEVGDDEEVHVAEHVAGQRRGERGAVLVAGEQGGRVVDLAEVGVQPVERFVERQIHRIRPAGRGRRLAAGVGHDPLDRDRAAGERHVRPRDLADLQVREGRETDRDDVAAGGVVVELGERAAQLGDLIEGIGGDMQPPVAGEVRRQVERLRADDRVAGRDRPGEREGFGQAAVAFGILQPNLIVELSGEVAGALVGHGPAHRDRLPR